MVEANGCQPDYGACDNRECDVAAPGSLAVKVQHSLRQGGSIDEPKSKGRDMLSVPGVFAATLILIAAMSIIALAGGFEKGTRTVTQQLSPSTNVVSTAYSFGEDGNQHRQRSLLLLRHAKSSWDNPDIPDFERPLNEKGLSDAKRLGLYLFENDVEPPQVIFSSPSIRTRQTLEGVQSVGWAQNVPVVFVDHLYDFEVHEPGTEMYSKVYRDFVSNLVSQYLRVMIVGHNPAICSLAQQLLPPNKSISKFRPATFCEVYWKVIEQDGWDAIGDEEGNLGILVKP